MAGNITGGYTVANITVSGRKLLPWLEVSASVHNLFDKAYADPGGQEHVQDTIPQDGRSLRVKVMASFGSVPGAAWRPFGWGDYGNGNRTVRGGPLWITLC